MSNAATGPQNARRKRFFMPSTSAGPTQGRIDKNRASDV